MNDSIGIEPALCSYKGEIILQDNHELRLQLVADGTESIEPLTNMVAQYTFELDQRRQQLCDDLAYFESKLIDLNQLDPHDFVGLAAIYRKHASHIRGLLAELEDSDDA